jgi:hypothetical protein
LRNVIDLDALGPGNGSYIFVVIGIKKVLKSSIELVKTGRYPRNMLDEYLCINLQVFGLLVLYPPFPELHCVLQTTQTAAIPVNS